MTARDKHRSKISRPLLGWQSLSLRPCPQPLCPLTPHGLSIISRVREAPCQYPKLWPMAPALILDGDARSFTAVFIYNRALGCKDGDPNLTALILSLPGKQKRLWSLGNRVRVLFSPPAYFMATRKNWIFNPSFTHLYIQSIKSLDFLSGETMSLSLVRIKWESTYTQYNLDTSCICRGYTCRYLCRCLRHSTYLITE